MGTHHILKDGTSYAIKGGTDLIAGTSYQIGGGRTLVNGTEYEIGFGSKFLLAITEDNGGNVPAGCSYSVAYGGSAYTGNNELLLKEGEHVTITLNASFKGYGYAMKILLNGVVVAGGNDYNAKQYTYVFTPKSNASIVFTLGSSNAYYICNITEE